MCLIMFRRSAFQIYFRNLLEFIQVRDRPYVPVRITVVRIRNLCVADVQRKVVFTKGAKRSYL